MSDTTIVFVRSEHSDYHKAVLHDDVLMSAEGCNLDELHGERLIETDEALLLPQVPRCKRCFPPLHEFEGAPV